MRGIKNDSVIFRLDAVTEMRTMEGRVGFVGSRVLYPSTSLGGVSRNDLCPYNT